MADLYNNRVQVFDSRGRFLVAWGEYGKGDGQLFLPIGLAIRGRRIFVIDQAQRVQRFDLDGQFETGWSLFDGFEDEFSEAFDIEVDRTGFVWVVETNQDRVRKFDEIGTLLATWDRSGPRPGAMQRPSSIALGRGGRVFVGASVDNRVQMFDSDGHYLLQWIPTTACAHQVGLSVSGLAVSSRGRIYVLDLVGDRVLEFVAPAEPTERTWWTWGAFGVHDGSLQRPGGIAVDDHGLVYVGDGQSRVQVFTVEGDFVQRLQPGGGFRVPLGIATFEDRVYVADLGTSCVQVFDGSGRHLGRWVLEEAAPGLGASPRGIATDDLGNVYVCAARKRIDVYDPDGVRLRSWGQEGSGPGQFEGVADVAVGEGVVYVVDTVHRRVSRFDVHGVFLGDLVTLPPSSLTASGLDAASGSRILVSTGTRIFEYDAEGNEVAAWGSEGRCEREFKGVGDIAADGQGRAFLTDVGNNRIQVVAPQIGVGDLAEGATWVDR